MTASGSVAAIETAVRFHEEPPSNGLLVETPWSEVWLSRDDWAEAFAAPAGTPHNEARDRILDELIAIVVDRHDRDVPSNALRGALQQNTDLVTTLHRAWFRRAQLAGTPAASCPPPPSHESM